MHHITISIKDDRLAKQVVWWLEHFKDDGLEIVSVEDLEDLKALQATRQEAPVSFEDYLTHADRCDVVDDRILIGRMLHRRGSYR